MRRSAVLSAVALGAALGLAACGPRNHVATITPAQSNGGPQSPELWLIEAMNGDQVAGATRICADGAIQAGFVRPSPVVNGQVCIRGREPVETQGTYSVRCHVDGQLFAVGSTITGDTEREFTVDMAVKPLDRKGPIYEQVRRYRLVGPCPSGWEIGDTAAPGARELVNSISGRTRPMPASG